MPAVSRAPRANLATGAEERELHSSDPPQAMLPSPSPRPSFLADAMLGRLARWLRVLNYDAEYATGTDAMIAAQAQSEGRHVLTRDRQLAAETRATGSLLVQSETPLIQLKEVVEHFGLSIPDELFQRCLVCNVPLEHLPRGTRTDAPPDVVAERRCPRCGRVYWEGSHTKRMRAALARTFDAPML